MKKKQIIYSAILSVGLFFASCMEKTNVISPNTPSAGDITFSVPTAALPAAPTGQPQVEQPSFNVVAANFGIIDDLKLTIATTGGLSNVKVQQQNTTTAAVSDKATLTASPSVDWTYPVNTLGAAGAAPAAPSTVTLLVTATDGTKTASRTFSVNVLDAFTLAAANPTTALSDSTITLAFTVPATNVFTNLTKVEYFSKKGVNATFVSQGSKAYSQLALATDNFKPVMPPDNVNLDKLDTMFYRFVATFATGRTITKNTSVRATLIPYTKTTSIKLFNPATATTVSTQIAYDFGKLAYNKAADADAIRDMILTTSGADVGFKVGTGNTTRFVLYNRTLDANNKVTEDLFLTPSHEKIKAAFLAGTAVTSVAAVAVPLTAGSVGDTYIVEIDGNTGKPASARYGILRFTAVVGTSSTDNNDNFSFDFKSK